MEKLRTKKSWSEIADPWIYRRGPSTVRPMPTVHNSIRPAMRWATQGVWAQAGVCRLRGPRRSRPHERPAQKLERGPPHLAYWECMDQKSIFQPFHMVHGTIPWIDCDPMAQRGVGRDRIAKNWSKLDFHYRVLFCMIRWLKKLSIMIGQMRSNPDLIRICEHDLTAQKGEPIVI